jgi:hypothetical protein
MSIDTRSPRLLLLVVGFAIWALALAVLYGVNAIGCAFAWPPAAQRAALVMLFAAHLTLLAWLAARQWQRYRSSSIATRQVTDPVSFVDYVGLGTLIAAFAATFFTLAPVLFLNLCV